MYIVYVLDISYYFIYYCNIQKMYKHKLKYTVKILKYAIKTFKYKKIYRYSYKLPNINIQYTVSCRISMLEYLLYIYIMTK